MLRGRHLRAIALAYPAVAFLTIVGTANRYLLDAVAGGLAMALGGGVAIARYSRPGACRAEDQMSNCSLAR